MMPEHKIPCSQRPHPQLNVTFPSRILGKSSPLARHPVKKKNPILGFCSQQHHPEGYLQASESLSRVPIHCFFSQLDVQSVAFEAVVP